MRTEKYRSEKSRSKNRIEELRSLLESKITSENIVIEEVLKLSRELDILILNYYTANSQNNDNK